MDGTMRSAGLFCEGKEGYEYVLYCPFDRQFFQPLCWFISNLDS